MSKRQSTIQSFFHSLRESKEKPVPDNNADNEICSSTENKCPNGASLKNKSNDEDVSESRNKKIKLSEIKLDNSESKNVKNIDKKPFEDQISSKKQIISLCNDFKGALDINIGISWFDALQKEFGKPYFRKLDDFLQQERKNHTIFPPHEQVWSWTQHFKVTDTRVVIIGQDPYHGPMQAHGLCFSVKHGVKPPPSLLNMYKELERDNDVQFIRPKHGFLEGWSKQGVLLLNAVLTVRSGQANSHKERGWEKITDAVIRLVSENCEKPVVFLLWGAYAQKKAASVDKRHHLLKSVHPSPLSAHRGFIGCNHFSKCNQILVEEGREPINWAQLD